MSEPQTFATHRRFHPLFHFVTFPLAMAYLVWTLWNLWKGHTFVNLMVAVGALALSLGAFLARFYGLRVQDRLIRLEETLRLQRVLPADLVARIPELRPSQFVGLRFASDGELASLVEAALKEGLGSEQIKRRIKSWRPDTFRV